MIYTNIMPHERPRADMNPGMTCDGGRENEREVQIFCGAKTPPGRKTTYEGGSLKL